MLDRVNFPLRSSQISEFVLEREYMNYFQLQQAIAELIDSNLIESKTIRNTSQFHLTSQGKETINYFGRNISPEIRKDIVHFLTENSYELRNEVSTVADYRKIDTNEFTVRCYVKERDINLIDLSLTVPTKEAAEAICSKWGAKNQEIYAYLMNELM